MEQKVISMILQTRKVTMKVLADFLVGKVSISTATIKPCHCALQREKHHPHIVEEMEGVEND